MSYDIFISYRRVGGAQNARILKSELENRGYRGRVFLDYDELKDGRFDKRIMNAIEEAPIFIFILSPGSLDRCINEDDWVRQEIFHAIRSERNIIPVDFDGLFPGFPVSTPAAILEGLGQHQFSELNSKTLMKESIDKLIRERISPIVAPVNYTPGYSDNQIIGAEIIVKVDTPCEIRRLNRRLAVATPDNEAILHLMRGKHQLEIVSENYPEIKKQIIYEIPDNNYSDILEINFLPDIIKIAETAPVRKDEHYGYADSFGNLLIDYKFKESKDFHEGLAAVRNHAGLWGFINKGGEEIITCKFKAAESFCDGLALVQNKDSLYGYINTDGYLHIPFNYTHAVSFKNKTSIVKNIEGVWGELDTNGRFTALSLFPIEKDGLSGFADEAGNIRIPCQYKKASIFSDGLAAVQNDEGLYGYIDNSGKFIIPCQFRNAGDFDNGVATVQEKNGIWGEIDKSGNFNPFELTPLRKSDLFGYADKSGNVRIPCIYTDAKEFSGGLALVKKDGLYGYIRINGEIAIPLQFKKAESFQDGLAVVSEDGEHYGYIDNSGKLIIPCQFRNARNFDNGIATVQEKNGIWGEIDKSGNFNPFELTPIRKTDLFGYADKSGNVRIPCIYTNAKEFSGGLALVKKDGLYGYIRINGEIAIPLQFKKAESFQDGLAVVSEDGEHYGYIDLQGRFENLPIFTYAEPFAGSEARVRNENRVWGFINKNFEFRASELSPVKADGFYNLEDEKGFVVFYGWNVEWIDGFHEGLAIVKNKNDGRYCVIDLTGETVFKSQYRIDPFKDGVAIVKTPDNSLGLIDKTGKELLSPIYKDIKYQGDGVFKFSKGVFKNCGLIDKTGKEIAPCIYSTIIYLGDGMFKVWKDQYTQKHPTSCGLIDKTGKQIVPCVYDCIWDFKDDLVRAEKNGETVFFDKTGKKILIFPKGSYSSIGDFENGVARVVKRKWFGLKKIYGLIDKTGKETAP